jgi:hypothetical protein
MADLPQAADALKTACQQANITLPADLTKSIDSVLTRREAPPVADLLDAVLRCGWVAAESLRPSAELSTVWTTFLSALLAASPRATDVFAPAIAVRAQRPTISTTALAEIDDSFPPLEEDRLRSERNSVRAVLAERREALRALRAGNAALQARKDAVIAMRAGGGFGKEPREWGSRHCLVIGEEWAALPGNISKCAEAIGRFEREINGNDHPLITPALQKLTRTDQPAQRIQVFLNEQLAKYTPSFYSVARYQLLRTHLNGKMCQGVSSCGWCALEGAFGVLFRILSFGKTSKYHRSLNIDSPRQRIQSFAIREKRWSES